MNRPLPDGDSNKRLPALDNPAMGTVFEKLIRRFNEENNEIVGATPWALGIRG